MLLWNLIGGAVLICYNLMAASIHFWILGRLGVLRVAVAAEREGLDVLKHHELAYDFGTLRPPTPTLVHNIPTLNRRSPSQ